MDDFSTLSGGLTSPATRASAITPSDSTDLSAVSRAIYIGTEGHVSLVTLAGNTVLFKNVPAGSFLPVRASRVRSTGTTATDLVALS